MDIHAVLLRRFWPVLFHLSVVLKYGLMVLLGCNIHCGSSQVLESVNVLFFDDDIHVPSIDITVRFWYVFSKK